MGGLHKVAGFEESVLCSALWQFEAIVNPRIASQQSPRLAVKPCTHFYNEIYMVLKNLRKLLWIQQWSFVILKKLLRSHLYTFFINILMVLEASGCCVKALLMLCNFQAIAVKPFRHFCNETFMFFGNSESCCKSIIDGLEYARTCCKASCALLHCNNYDVINFSGLV